MKIIKEGQIPKGENPIEFICDYCNTIFEAERGEYKILKHRNGSIHKIYSESFLAFCPICGNFILRKIPEEEWESYD